MQACDLSNKHCVPCEGGSKPLERPQIEEHIKILTSSWQVIDSARLQQKFKFKNFREAMLFVNKVADLAESEGHHPDIKISYNRVTIDLSTNAIKGLSENDFIMASKIEKLMRLLKK